MDACSAYDFRPGAFFKVNSTSNSYMRPLRPVAVRLRVLSGWHATNTNGMDEAFYLHLTRTGDFN